LDKVHSRGRMPLIALAKLLLQVSWGAPFFLGLLIQAVRNFFGRALSFDLAILPTYLAVLLLMNASMFGILKNIFLTSLFFMRSSLTRSVRTRCKRSITVAVKSKIAFFFRL
jgi:hypothetical protein